MSISLRLSALLLGMLASAGAASAQVYRDEPSAPVYRDSPAVLTPPRALPPPDTQPIINAFANRYASAKKPRLAVWWNRQLSDRLMSNSTAQITDNRSAGYSAGYGSGYAYSDRTVQAGVTGGTLDPARAGGGEAMDWRIADAFQNTLIEAGARMVDRNVMVRAFGREVGVDYTTNIQELEIGALTGKADLLMEILMTPDASTPSGWLFRVQMKNIKTGIIRVTLTTDAMPRQAAPVREYIATSSGFERAPTPGPRYSFEELGRELALQAMAKF